tara:strand:- start:194 stop:400 length:207 start_codon:yes stop_codon:yes gene_type:complete
MTEASRNWFEKGEIGQLKSWKRRANKELKDAKESLEASALSYTRCLKEVEDLENQIYALEAKKEEAHR